MASRRKNRAQKSSVDWICRSGPGDCWRLHARRLCLGSLVIFLFMSLLVDRQLALVVYPDQYDESENHVTAEQLPTKVSKSVKGEARLSLPFDSNLTEDLDILVEKLANPFKQWQAEPYEWCLKGKRNDVQLRGQGLLFARTFKTGSTSASAVHLQIAHRVGQRVGPNQNRACHFQYKHTWSLQNGMRFKKRPSRLWTIVRDPSQRSISAYNYYIIGQKNRTWDSNHLQRFMRHSKNHQTMQLRTNRTQNAAGGGQPTRKVDPQLWTSTRRVASLMQHEIFDVYDFVAVNERWDESMAVLQLLWGLQEEDMMYIDTKSSNSWTHNWSPRNSCFWIPTKPALDNATLDFLKTSFQKRNLDFLLHRWAWRSLDLTIQSLGSSRVQEVIDRQSRMRTYVQEFCRNNVTFPCSSTGDWQAAHVQDCYKNDIYCGRKCLNAAIDQYLAMR